MSTKFTVPCAHDRAVLAIQDALNQLQWNISTLTSSEVVASQQPAQPMNAARIKLTATMRAVEEGTEIGVTSSTMAGAYWDGKKRCTEMMGTFVNAVSLRVQTQSIAINPTVALGEGQGPRSAAPLDRVSQLMKLKELLDAGLLTMEEFEQEKARILAES